MKKIDRFNSCITHPPLSVETQLRRGFWALNYWHSVWKKFKITPHSEIVQQDKSNVIASCSKGGARQSKSGFCGLLRHFIPRNDNKVVAFTLAEVLITLTIIGVIAALTIPNLMKSYEKRQIEVGLAKTYQELSNVIKRSEIDNSPIEDWPKLHAIRPDGTSEYIKKYFAPYMRLKPCNRECFAGFPSGFSSYYGGYRYPNGTYISNISPTYFLEDGRTFQFYNFITYDNDQYAQFVVDVNGKRGKSILGVDVFMFVLSYGTKRLPKGLYTGSMGSGYGHYRDTKEQLYSYCSPNQTTNLNECSIILQRNGWKFPDDYPIKF